MTIPFEVSALGSQKVSQNLLGETKVLLAQFRRNRDRQFSVYYRNSRQRQWTLEGYHANRRDADSP